MNSIGIIPDVIQTYSLFDTSFSVMETGNAEHQVGYTVNQHVRSDQQSDQGSGDREPIILPRSCAGAE